MRGLRLKVNQARFRGRRPWLTRFSRVGNRPPELRAPRGRIPEVATSSQPGPISGTNGLAIPAHWGRGRLPDSLRPIRFFGVSGNPEIPKFRGIPRASAISDPAPRGGAPVWRFRSPGVRIPAVATSGELGPHFGRTRLGWLPGFPSPPCDPSRISGIPEISKCRRASRVPAIPDPAPRNGTPV